MRTIRGKLSVIAILSIVGLLIIASFIFLYSNFQKQANNERDKLLNAVLASKELNAQFSFGRAMDQMYLRKPSRVQGNLVKNQVEQVISLTDQYIAEFESNEEIQQHFASIRDELEKYQMEFNTLELLIRDIGYTSDEGMQGDINEGALEVEKLLNELNDSELIAAFNNIRQAEATYLRDRSEENYAYHVELASEFRKDLARRDLDPTIKSSLLSTSFDYQESLKYIYFNYKNQNDIADNFDRIADSINVSVKNVEREVSQNVATLTEEVEKGNQAILFTILGISALLIVLIGIVVYYISLNIVKSIHSVKKGAEKIGNGNFAARVEVKGKDELAQLANTFNNMAEKVQNSLTKIMQSADEVQSSSQNLTAIAEQTTAQASEVGIAIKQVAAGASEQSVQLEEGTGIIRQVSDAIEYTSKLSNEIAVNAKESENESIKGIQTVHELEVTNEEFNQLSNQLITQVENVTDHFKQISNIIGTIEEIAENTNLLSLNAAIESARAGEAGRGFAVVANEVRKLATRSKEETQRITNIVKGLNEQMQILVASAEKFNNYREIHGNTVQLTRAAFDNIAEQVKNISLKVQEVTEAVQNVNVGNEELTNKLDEIHAISEESSAAAEEVTASSETQIDALYQVNDAATKLSEISVLLHQEISQFNLLETEEQMQFMEMNKKKKKPWNFKLNIFKKKK